MELPATAKSQRLVPVAERIAAANGECSGAVEGNADSIDARHHGPAFLPLRSTEALTPHQSGWLRR